MDPDRHPERTPKMPENSGQSGGKEISAENRRWRGERQLTGVNNWPRIGSLAVKRFTTEGTEGTKKKAERQYRSEDKGHG
jgi:hypothetical protein